MTVRVCFVCLGNICRSPAAAAIMQAKVKAAGLENEIEIDSAGTGNWHIGESAHKYTLKEAKKRGIPINHVVKQFNADLFDMFDYILAADHENMADLLDLAPDQEAAAKVQLLRSFDPDADDDEVPDPFYDELEGFAQVFDMIDAACDGLLEHIENEHALTSN